MKGYYSHKPRAIAVKLAHNYNCGSIIDSTIVTIYPSTGIIFALHTYCAVMGRYRARFQASSGHSDSVNRPGYEAGGTTDCGTKCLRVLIFASFKIRQNKFPQTCKNYRKHFSRKNLLQSKYSLT